jgi:hypothetical protein
MLTIAKYVWQGAVQFLGVRQIEVENAYIRGPLIFVKRQIKILTLVGYPFKKPNLSSNSLI